MSLNETLNLLSYIQDIYNIDLLEVECSRLSINSNEYEYFITYKAEYDIISMVINKDNVINHFE